MSSTAPRSARRRVSTTSGSANSTSIALDHVSTTVLHFRRSHRHRCHRRQRCRLLAVTVSARTLVSGWCRIMRRRSKLHRHYYDPQRVGSYGDVVALQRVSACRTERRKMVVDAGRGHPSQTDETPLQTPLRRGRLS